MMKSPTVEAPNFGGLIRAEVITNVDPLGEGRVGVRVRKIMCDNMQSERPEPPSRKESLSKSAVDNNADNNFGTKIPITNYQWARPVWFLNTNPSEKTVTNELTKVGRPTDGGTHQKITLGEQLEQTSYTASTGSYNVPRIGTTVWVVYEDEDPQKLYYLPIAPTLTGQVTPLQMVEQTVNKSSVTKKVNVHVMREWHNGSCLYYDTNDDRNCFTLKFQNGHRLKFEFNADASAIVMNTETGHILEMVDRSSAIGDDNSLDRNDQDIVVNHGTFIRIQSAKGHRILLDDNGGLEKIHARTARGHQLLMDDPMDEVTLKTRSGSQIVMQKGDNILMDTGGLIDLVSGGTIQLTSSSQVIINSPKVLVNTTGDEAKPVPSSLAYYYPAGGNNA